MRIGIDCRPLRAARTSGIPAFVRGVLAELVDLDRTNDYILYAHRPFAAGAAVDALGRAPNVTWRAGGWCGLGTPWMQLELPGWLGRDRIDLFWGTQHIVPLRRPPGTRTVVTVHDLVPFVLPGTMHWRNRAIHHLLLSRSIRAADTIVASSRATLAAIARYVPGARGRREVVHLGAGPAFGPRDRAAARRQVSRELGLESPFLLTVGTLEPRKNLVAVVRAFARLAGRIPHTLAIVGPVGWKSAAFLREVEGHPARHRIRLLGYVDDALLPEVYAAADLFLFASLYEGFGLPVVEAMACGTPVVASDRSSIPEVVGEAGLTVDPEAPEAIAAAVARLVTDGGLRETLIARGYERAAHLTWRRAAERMHEVFAATVAG
ncbi:MAG: glycosyltransferase family 1 protein [Candidatus Eiseniibacteriota bacterium]|jgi:glycosyltransferase involved in cell wall biosynthesis